ncbi:hypothetical protein T02_314 [Trichinella nativa]|uniref:Uncharacterized protein n=1 Tax=Trichinella nativa TaxID=6335 RepID=A0A0V1L1P5_9BILA|nr:hypothetical protein T02_314 [Trichinella nativa]
MMVLNGIGLTIVLDTRQSSAVISDVIFNIYHSVLRPSVSLSSKAPIFDSPARKRKCADRSSLDIFNIIQEYTRLKSDSRQTVSRYIARKGNHGLITTRRGEVATPVDKLQATPSGMPQATLPGMPQATPPAILFEISKNFQLFEQFAPGYAPGIASGNFRKKFHPWAMPSAILKKHLPCGYASGYFKKIFAFRLWKPEHAIKLSILTVKLREFQALLTSYYAYEETESI